MLTSIMPFQYQQNQVRAFTKDNQPWFVAKDVCDALNIKWSGDKVTLSKIKKSWKMGLEIQDSQGRMQTAICINEPGVYKLSFRSNKPEAEAFTDWIAEDVLPRIRKTGMYGQVSRENELLREIDTLQKTVIELQTRENTRLAQDKAALQSRVRSPRPVSEAEILIMLDLHDQGYTPNQIGKQIGRPGSTVRGVLKRELSHLRDAG